MALIPKYRQYIQWKNLKEIRGELMNTPFFLIDENELKKNIDDFKTALNKIWPNSQLAYSVKTNSLPWLLEYLKDENVFAEVVSDEELDLAILCGYSMKSIIFNGPIKGEEHFKKAIEGEAILNLDSKNDLEFLKKYGSEERSIGIRVNVSPQLFSKEDIGYEEDGFRFGFTDENGSLQKALETVYECCPKVKVGLHLHCNSITRSIAVYKTIAEYAAYLIKKYELNLDFIDIGGGFFGGVEGKPTSVDYIDAIKKELEKVVNINKTKLIVEPGSAIIGSVVELHTSVIDVKDTKHARVVTTDGSRIHIDPLWKKERYMYSTTAPKEQKTMPKQIVCGYTCMDHDRIMILENEQELRQGDKIVYYRVGAYSMTFGGMFIRYLPEVYVKRNDKLEKVRERISTNQYFKIQSFIEKGE